MSLSGTTNTYLPPTLDGLNIIEADAIYINGIPIDTENLVPYTGASKNVNLGIFNFQTLGSISAKQHILPLFGSTIMTSPTTSSIFYADAWKLNNTVQISSLGGGSFLSTSYLHITDVSNTSTLLTLQSDGIADFADTKVRVSTMATNEYDVVNLSTLTSAVAFIENVNALNYVPYNGATDNLNMGGSTITTTGLVNAGALRITSSVSNADYTLSVNTYDQLEFTNLSNGSILKTNGSDLFVSGDVNCATLGATNVEAGSNIYLAKGSTAEWRTTLGMSDEYEILDNAGVMRSRLSKSTGLTVSTLNITQVPSATPTYALGVNGGGSVVSFAVPTTSGLVPYTGATTTVNLGSQSIYATTARFTGITSATPSLALGVDGSGNLNTFTVPSATNILPLNNVFTGTNTFQNTVQVSGIGVNLGVSLGSIIKSTATVGSFSQLTGGGATSSPSLEFHFGGNRRGYIGDSTASDLIIASDNSAKLNFATAGTSRMTIDTAGNVNVLGRFKKANDVNPATTYIEMIEGGASNSPYIAWYLNGNRKCYMGYATASNFDLAIENGAGFHINTNGSVRLDIQAGGLININNGLNVAGGAIECANQPFCIVGAVPGASVFYPVGAVWGAGSRLFAYTSAGMANSGTSGWEAGSGAFWLVKTGRWQVNWSFYWNNFSGGSRGVLLHFNSAGALLETRYCALSGAGIGADTTMAYSTLIYGSAGDFLQCQFQSGSGTLYFGGITHTHATFHFVA